MNAVDTGWYVPTNLTCHFPFSYPPKFPSPPLLFPLSPLSLSSSPLSLPLPLSPLLTLLYRITDENPHDKAAEIAATGFQTPIDEIEAASRIVDPVCRERGRGGEREERGRGRERKGRGGREMGGREAGGAYGIGYFHVNDSNCFCRSYHLSWTE